MSAELYSGDGRDEILNLYLREWEDTTGPVLEPMCGTGDFLIAFAERDVEVDGVDASQHILAILRQRCEQKGLNPGVYLQLLQDLDLPRRYGYVFIPDRGFALIPVKQQALQSLKVIRKHIIEGGKLALDVKQPRQTLDDGDIPAEWQHNRPDGSVIKGTNKVSYEDGGQIWRVHTRMELWNNGQITEREESDYRERFYKESEFRALLTEAGFRDIQVKRAYDGGEPGAGDDLVFLAFNPNS
jgi:ubiquinone/menaquinone biosynthesis C-methylase UbiE